MGYLERLVIGVIVVISAYSLLEGVQQRHHFHNTITQLFTSLQLQHCYCCIESLRIGFAALVFTAGITLVFDISILTGIFTELMMVALEGAKIKDCCCFCSAQTLLVHLLLLIVLINNWRENRAALQVQEQEEASFQAQPEPSIRKQKQQPKAKEQPKPKEPKNDHSTKTHPRRK